MKTLEFREIEYKYDATNIKLSKFLQLMEKLEEKHQGQMVIDSKKVSSWDIYYRHEKEEDKAIRYRQSEKNPELTVKVKTSEKNNNHRVEINLELSNETPQREQEKAVENLTKLLDCPENFRIMKTCFIHFFGPLNYVYYIVYDIEMKELRRFIEIEFSEKEAKYHTEEYVFGKLNEFEVDLIELGITPKHRLKKSLFETYRKAS